MTDAWTPGRLDGSALPVVLAITGASGAPYAVRLLEVLAKSHVPVWLIVSSHGFRLLDAECGITDMNALEDSTGGDWRSVVVFPDEDRGALPASGSQRTRGMVICPCSMGTVAAIAHGLSQNLIHRAADVHLKEKRKLILVPRETPLGLIQLKNLAACAEAGAMILPAMPAFYTKPESVQHMVDFVVARICDQLQIENHLLKRWGTEQGEEG